MLGLSAAQAWAKHTCTAAAVVVVAFFSSVLHSQSQPKVDFARDVQPILQRRCVECHGPTQQMNGYRLDRRSSALGGVIRPNIVPGSSESSRMYRRVVSSRFGLQMPPTGVLPKEEMETLRRWIDEGAVWPDELANEADRPPADPEASRAIEAIQRADRAAALRILDAAPGAINRPGPYGSTPLMEAAVSADDELVAELLKRGADPNIRNHAAATALMYALENARTVRLLLEAGADPNAASDFGRTPVALAAAQPRSSVILKLLLAHGAKPTAATLATAATRSDIEAVRLLLAAGVKDSGTAATLALRSKCAECLAEIEKAGGRRQLRTALLSLLPPAGPGDPSAIRQALDRGADVNAKDSRARTPLMLAAIVDEPSAETVRLLVEHGASVPERTPEGLTAADFAARSGNSETVRILREAGAAAPSPLKPPGNRVRSNTPDAAVRRSLPLLQGTARQFYAKSGCVSCHHNTLTQVTVAAARRRGFAVDERSAADGLAAIAKDIRSARDQALQGLVIPGGFVTTTGYVLAGLSAGGHRSDVATDALVRLLRITQTADGRWLTTYRPPSEASEITATAVSLRGLQLYGSTDPASRDQAAVRAAAAWLAHAAPRATEDRAYRLMGLTWADAPAQLRKEAMEDLIKEQRPDGGWAQTRFLAGDAYATGQVLVALADAGVGVDSPVYRKGVRYLLRTQLTDGSWFVQTRTQATQIYFESGFPHGESQFISAAATNWATQALVRACGEPKAAGSGARAVRIAQGK